MSNTLEKITKCIFIWQKQKCTSPLANKYI